MKISDIKTFVVANPPPSFGGNYFLFLKLVTDDNIIGYGEAYNIPFSPHLAAQMIEDVCERHLLGSDPHHVEELWNRIYRSGYTGHPDLVMMSICSAIEMACWAIIGKAADKPVYELLGGRVHEALRGYTYLYPMEGDSVNVYEDSDLAAQRAAEMVALGFTAVKFDPVGPYSIYDPYQLPLEALERSELFVRKIRGAVGHKADILFGTHGQPTPSSAIRLARRLEPYDPLWFEEPTATENTKAMARIAASTSIPIATGERLSTKHDFARVLQDGAASILQMDLAQVGGILEAKKIAAMAEAFYAEIAPHLYCGPIAGLANIQLATCSPNFLILEGIFNWQGFHADILTQPVRFEDGYVIPPTGAGLGIELNEALAEAHPYTGNDLHLQVHPRVVHPRDSGMENWR